ncbi:MauE/DoxX family redox-associated membrane protein [Streptomyces sp. NPDC020731]|uniref:MauE/DoxX family redox-associated membrane protein n=1 Tax=Streptomyces sp. NPDC020731 TaxID=3365085 RepID=UPI0037A77BFC
MRELPMQYVLLAVRCLLCVVFLAAVVGKVAGAGAFSSFCRSLHGMRLLPAELVRPVAAAVVTAEALVCLTLVLPVRHAAAVGLMAAAVLLSVFTGGIALVLGRGTDARCRCFGSADAVVGARHLLRNAGLTVLAVTASVTSALAPFPTGGVRPAGAVVAVAAGVVGAALIVMLDDIVSLFAAGSAALPRPVTEEVLAHRLAPSTDTRIRHAIPRSSRDLRRHPLHDRPAAHPRRDQAAEGAHATARLPSRRSAGRDGPEGG